jgi:hypothetical protein
MDLFPSCAHCNECLVALTDMEYLDHLNNYKLFQGLC